jgi:hypothetical protein
MHSFLRHSLASKITAALLLGTLAIRALLPLGYMPGNLLEGKFAELCPVASAATYALLPQDESHQHHAHHGHATDGNDYSMDSACPIGTSLLADVLPGFDVQILLGAGPEVFHQLSTTRGYLARFESYYPARAPPLS